MQRIRVNFAGEVLNLGNGSTLCLGPSFDLTEKKRKLVQSHPEIVTKSLTNQKESQGVRVANPKKVKICLIRESKISLKNLAHNRTVQDHALLHRNRLQIPRQEQKP